MQIDTKKIQSHTNNISLWKLVFFFLYFDRCFADKVKKVANIIENCVFSIDIHGGNDYNI